MGNQEAKTVTPRAGPKARSRPIGLRPFLDWPAWLTAAVRHGRPVFPTTSNGAEIAILVAFIGSRFGTIAQVVPSLPTALLVSQRAWLWAIALGCATVWSMLFAIRCVRARTLSGSRLIWADLLVANCILVLQPLFVPSEYLIGTWVGWGFAFALNAVAISGGGMRRRREIVAAISLTGLCYILATAPQRHGQIEALVSNLVSCVVFAILLRVLAGYVRRLAEDADLARADAVRNALSAERDRHRLLLHDSAGILKLFATGSIPPDVLDIIRQQADSESNRIRSFLSGNLDAEPVEGSGRLIDVIARVVHGFRDLPIDLVIDLAESVRLPEQSVVPLSRALTALMHNIRLHAAAGSVVVHADHDAGRDSWEVTVRDDGAGFDVANGQGSFGLAVQVRRNLADIGVQVSIESSPGNGTTVTMTGDCAVGPGISEVGELH